MQVHKVAVSFVDDPWVRANSIEVGTCVWTDQTLSLSLIFMALVISHLNLKLNVVSNIGVLPHEELKANRVLTKANLFMQLTSRVLDYHSWYKVVLSKLCSRIWCLHSALAWIRTKELMYFFSILCWAWVATDSLFNNFVVIDNESSLKIDVALPSITTESIHILWASISFLLELSLNLFSRKFVLALQSLIWNSKECNDFRRPKKFVIGNLIAESLQVLNKTHNLVGILLVQRLVWQSIVRSSRLC